MVQLHVQPDLPCNLMSFHVIQHRPLVQLQTNSDAGLLVYCSVYTADLSSIHLSANLKGIQ